MNDSASVLVVPCYNEQTRIDADAFLSYARSGRARLLFVDDGSTDGTPGTLSRMEQGAPGRVHVLSRAENRGKAEAVRLGLLRALDEGAEVVGYADADLSTPLEEVSRLFEVVERGAASVALGSRVARLGARIQRKAHRHYLGRVFATAASLALDVAVYDTQCGAKCFSSSRALRSALEVPFLSSWIFDVELLGRLLTGAPGVEPLAAEAFVEVPLARWRDVGGSALRLGGMARSGVDFFRVWRDLRRRRRALAVARVRAALSHPPRR